MAGNAHPWRDIPSLADWDKVLAGTSQTDPGVDRVVWMKHLLKQLNTSIRYYHAIQKDDWHLFPSRVAELASVKRQAETYFGPRGLGAKARLHKADGHKGLDTTNTTKYPLETWVVSLAKRAQKKADYLTVLYDWYNSPKAKPTYLDANDLWNLLQAKQQNNVKGANQEFLSTSVYAKMEKVDPFHRNVVFFFTQDQSDIAPYHNNAMATAFREWIWSWPGFGPDPGAGRKWDASFFEWLEYHPICTGTPVATQGFDMGLKTGVHMINYAPANLYPIKVSKFWPIRVNLGTGGGWENLNTPTMLPASIKGPPGGAAFVWDVDGHLWVHEHLGADFRHTSFKAGKKIRCSGMITVADGKVTHLSDESGHYAPERKQLWYFYWWLENAGNCIGNNLQVNLYEYGAGVYKPGHEFWTECAGDFGFPDEDILAPYQ